VAQPDAAAERRAARGFLLLGAAWLALDQATKALVVACFGEPGRVHRVLVPDYCELTYSLNAGAAFGLLAQHGSARVVLVLVALAALGAVWACRRTIWALPWPQRVGLALATAGALGNLVDRLARGGLVVDFLRCHLRWGSWHYLWPDFNVADIGVTCGMALYIVHALYTDRQLAAREAQAPIDTADARTD
jgi:signal peptidase II